MSIAIYDEDKHRMVEVESREFEHQAKRFLGTKHSHFFQFAYPIENKNHL